MRTRRRTPWADRDRQPRRGPHELRTGLRLTMRPPTPDSCWKSSGLKRTCECDPAAFRKVRAPDSVRSELAPITANFGPSTAGLALGSGRATNRTRPAILPPNHRTHINLKKKSPSRTRQQTAKASHQDRLRLPLVPRHMNDINHFVAIFPTRLRESARHPISECRGHLRRRESRPVVSRSS